MLLLLIKQSISFRAVTHASNTVYKPAFDIYRRSCQATRKIVESNEDSSKDSLPSNTIFIKNTQKKIPIDVENCRNTVYELQKILGITDFDVDIWFCSENKIRELNDDWRGKRKSTDVLSFPACDFTSPEKFKYDDPTLEFSKHLGDIVIAPMYVVKQCERDKKCASLDTLYHDDDDDAGVSKAMAKLYDVQDRIPLLIIHGLLHLLGYDHETNEDWILMTTKETHVLRLLEATKIRSV